MISHVFIGIGDFERARTFYAPLMELLGHELKFASGGWAGWKPKDADRPLFLDEVRVFFVDERAVVPYVPVKESDQ